MNNKSKFLVSVSVCVLAVLMPCKVERGHVIPAYAQAAEEAVNLDTAKAFVTQVSQDGIGFLSDPSLKQEQQIQKFKILLSNNFDMNTIARFALGRYWKTATDAQKREYLDLFEKMVVDVYSRRFNDYQGQRMSIREARPEGNKDVIVTTFVISPDQPEVQVDWRVRNKGGTYKIVDIIVEGVSMALTQRSEFSSVIQRGGGDVGVLLAHLRN